MTIYTIYLITNLINNKKYVGQTKNNPKKRFREHKGAYNDCLISRAIKKYGKDNFSFEIIYQTLDIDHVDFLECHFIEQHNTFSNGGHGYNLTTGGNLNKIISIMSRQKMSTSQMNKILTEETKLKMSKSRKGVSVNLGKVVSEETKRKMSEIMKGKLKEIITCPHCDKSGGLPAMKRWHFNNCKFYINNFHLQTTLDFFL